MYLNVPHLHKGSIWKNFIEKNIYIEGYGETYIEVHGQRYFKVMEEHIVTFFEYMKQHYFGKEGRKSDLADDMVSDEAEFPARVSTKDRDGHRIIRDYLESCRACDACLEVFEECWEEYEACEKNRSNTPS